MWSFQTTQHDESTHRLAILEGEMRLSFTEVLTLWHDDPSFREAFTGELAASPFEAFRWETPPVTQATIARAFECVLLRTDVLARPGTPEVFAEQFQPGHQIETFSNLGGDAVMIVPVPLGAETQYAHLAEFLRTAPTEQIHALWIAVAESMERRINERPVWLSTAGMGVAWLHVRLDDRPKYYAHTPYREL